MSYAYDGEARGISIIKFVLWVIFMMPGTILLWISYMFPRHGEVWSSGRQYRSQIMRVIVTLFFYLFVACTWRDWIR